MKNFLNSEAARITVVVYIILAIAIITNIYFEVPDPWGIAQTTIGYF